jgi:hypothetical protein
MSKAPYEARREYLDRGTLLNVRIPGDRALTFYRGEWREAEVMKSAPMPSYVPRWKVSLRVEGLATVQDTVDVNGIGYYSIPIAAPVKI